jgi:hypothetical protein
MEELIVDHVKALVKSLRGKAVKLLLDDVRGLSNQMRLNGWPELHGIDAETMAELKRQLEEELRRRGSFNMTRE